ncbi:MAG: hypothetical protein P1P72_00485 [ANME-2 cluster archaeon]|nr:hypothetical protein [ANME-2 cluster archaeon]
MGLYDLVPLICHCYKYENDYKTEKIKYYLTWHHIYKLVLIKIGKPVHSPEYNYSTNYYQVQPISFQESLIKERPGFNDIHTGFLPYDPIFYNKE